MADRYELFGIVAQERDDNSGLTKDNQKVEEGPVVYTTDSHEEAEEIRKAGGFLKDGEWTVVTGYRDNQKQESETPKKEDF